MSSGSSSSGRPRSPPALEGLPAPVEGDAAHGPMTTPKPPVPVWRWGLWFATLGLAVLIFYVLLTPVWLGLRALAWLADKQARRHGG